MTHEPQFNCTKLVDHFGGPVALANSAAKSGHIINVKVIYRWRTRNQISSGMLARLAQHAKDTGRTFDLTEFIE